MQSFNAKLNTTKAKLFIICGQVGAGKTTTAKYLSKMVGVPVASVDSTLKSILPKPSFVGKDKPPTNKELQLCYNTFALLADYSLSQGKSIIIDGAFAKKTQRNQIIQVAKKFKTKYYILYIYCPDDVLKERANKRFNNGKGVGWKAHLKIKKIYEPLTLPHSVIDTSKDIFNQLKSCLKFNKINFKHI